MRVLATALQHILHGNCITIGESEKGSETVYDMKKKREGIAEIDSIYNIKVLFVCLHSTIWLGFLIFRK